MGSRGRSRAAGPSGLGGACFPCLGAPCAGPVRPARRLWSPAAPRGVWVRCLTSNRCFRTGTDQGNPTVESKHSIAMATQGSDAM